MTTPYCWDTIDYMDKPYSIDRPKAALPLICDSPHSGTTYPDDFGHAVPRALLRAAEDTHVEALWQAAPDVGATLLAAHFPRSYIDANRTLDDLDPELLDAPWPKVDEEALKQDEIELMLQVNGKLRGAIHVPAAADKALIEQIALASEAFIKQADGAAPKKVIVVPGRLVNVVI